MYTPYKDCSGLSNPFSGSPLDPYGIIAILKFNVVGLPWSSSFVAIGYTLHVVGKANIVDIFPTRQFPRQWRKTGSHAYPCS